MTATEATTELLQSLVDTHGVSIIVIEHNMDFIKRLSAQITVLHLGKVIAEGSFDEIAANPQVADVYLGNHA